MLLEHPGRRGKHKVRCHPLWRRPLPVLPALRPPPAAFSSSWRAPIPAFNRQRLALQDPAQGRAHAPLGRFPKSAGLAATAAASGLSRREPPQPRGGKRGESAGQSDLRGRLGRRARGISMCRSAWRLTSNVPMTSTQSRIYGCSARARWFSEVPPSFETLETRLKAVYWNCEEATADERFGQRQHQPKLPM